MNTNNTLLFLTLCSIMTMFTLTTTSTAMPTTDDIKKINVTDTKEMILNNNKKKSSSSNGGVPVYVMLELDTINLDGSLKDVSGLTNNLKTLKSGNVYGVLIDVWFGVVEGDAEKQYNFKGYLQLADICKSIGLKLQTVMSFHQCGGNVGDACDIPLPRWALEADNIWYQDQNGQESKEYISLFADHTAIFPSGRTPHQVYVDYMDAFVSTFNDYFDNTITEIQVGLGPAGEMRYPAYPLSRWTYCGVGAFQCFGTKAIASFQNYTKTIGHPEWNMPPSNAGGYSDRLGPKTPFFQSGGFDSDYGKAFLTWYFQSLLTHGSEILSAARSTLDKNGHKTVTVATKIAGIHWWYKSNSHPAELTAGYYNANGYNAYYEIANMCAKVGCKIDFTCLEMQDDEQDATCDCGPYELVQQVEHAAFQNNIGFGGENALPRFDQTAYNTILNQAHNNGRVINDFTYLRLSAPLLQDNNFNTFKGFVNSMQGL